LDTALSVCQRSAIVLSLDIDKLLLLVQACILVPPFTLIMQKLHELDR